MPVMNRGDWVASSLWRNSFSGLCLCFSEVLLLPRGYVSQSPEATTFSTGDNGLGKMPGFHPTEDRHIGNTTQQFAQGYGGNKLEIFGVHNNGSFIG